MSIRHIYSSGSIRVYKCSHCPYMPEYSSASQTLCVCVSICIWTACKGCLSVSFSVIKLIGIDFDIISMFYSFMVFLLVLGFIGCLWELIGLLVIITTSPISI